MAALVGREGVGVEWAALGVRDMWCLGCRHAKEGSSASCTVVCLKLNNIMHLPSLPSD